MATDLFEATLHSKLPLFEAKDANGHQYKIFLNGIVEGFSPDTKVVKWFIPFVNTLLAQANQKSKSASLPASTDIESRAGLSHSSASESSSPR